MLARDVEMFIEHCENKGLSTKTVGSYEQTLRLLILYLDGEGITQTEKITHIVIQGYIKQIFKIELCDSTIDVLGWEMRATPFLSVFFISKLWSCSLGLTGRTALFL